LFVNILLAEEPGFRYSCTSRRIAVKVDCFDLEGLNNMIININPNKDALL